MVSNCLDYHNFLVSFPIRWSVPPSFVFIFKILGNFLNFHIKPATRLSINVYVEKHPAILIGIVWNLYIDLKKTAILILDIPVGKQEISLSLFIFALLCLILEYNCVLTLRWFPLYENANQRHADTYLLLLGPPQPQPQPQPQPSLPRSPASSRPGRLRGAAASLRVHLLCTQGCVQVAPALSSSLPLLPLPCPQGCTLCLYFYFCPAGRSIRAVLLVHTYAFASDSRSSLSGGLTLLPSEFSHRALWLSAYQLSFLGFCYRQTTYSFPRHGGRNCSLNLTFSFYVANMPI